jgi:hypothetical protein
MSNTAGVPSLNSFAQAKARYEQTTPIRGNKDKVRPLGFRKHHRMASIAMPDADTVVFSYYGRPFVTWRSDNTFTVTNGVYQSAYTAKHLSYFLPRRWYTDWVDCAMVIHNYGADKRYFIPVGAAFQFAPVGEGFELVNKPVAYSIRKKRNSLKRELAQQQSFKDWLTVVLSVASVVSQPEVDLAADVLRGELGLLSREWFVELRRNSYQDANRTQEDHVRIHNEYEMSENLPATSCQFGYATRRKFHTAGCERLLQWVTGEDADKWVLAMNLIAGRAGRRRYLHSGEWRCEHHISVERVMDYLQDITLHAHRDTAFYKAQMPDGVLPSRSNRRYFQAVALSQ